MAKQGLAAQSDGKENSGDQKPLKKKRACPEQVNPSGAKPKSLMSRGNLK